MSSIKDLIFVTRKSGLLSLGRRVYKELGEDNVFTNAAAMAYAWVFAIFPFFIFLLTLIPYVPERFRDYTKDMVDRVIYTTEMPEAARSAIHDGLKNVIDTPHGGLLSFGLILTLYAASGGMNMTMSALDQAYDVTKPRPFVVKRLWAMVLTVVVCICFIVIGVAVPGGDIAMRILEKYIGELPIAVQRWFSGPTILLLTVARYIIGLTVMQIMIGMVYHFGRSGRDRLRFFTPGAIFTALGWLVMGAVMRVYFEHFANYSKVYGAVAGMVIMLMVFYLDATILLAGAELDSEIDAIKSEIATAELAQLPAHA